MPLMTRCKETVEETTKEEKPILPEVVFTVNHPKRPDVKTVIIEDPPRSRMIRVRHQFYAGGHTEFYVKKPWSYFLFRGETNGKTLLAGIFFANGRLTSLDQEGVCAAPMPNVDYGRDHGIGVCLWVSGKKFGPTVEEAAVECHKYFWTSDFNTGVNYYDTGRPVEIGLLGRPGSWLESMTKWEALTREGREIIWLRINACDTGKPVKTLRDAYDWLSREKDFNYR